MFTFIPGADVSRPVSSMVLLMLLLLPGIAGATALDDYVAQEDGSYGWTSPPSVPGVWSITWT